jgi:hypothetical protein
MPTDDLSAVRRVQLALREAVARTNHASGRRDDDLVFIGYVETTMWACALDELLPKIDPEYEGRRDEDPGGQVLRGLRWARNQGVHQLMGLHRDAGGFTFPLTFPASTSFAPVWLQRSETKGHPRPQPQNEQAYDKHVAGQLVAATLTNAQRFLWEKAIPGQYVERLPWEVR